mmetsp:Transcript_579/g.1142  ORF Transcript_579/g.1142 Transcript_579/m.1142 type:complete len:195 (-) Transcript_579:104-688(-)
MTGDLYSPQFDSRYPPPLLTQHRLLGEMDVVSPPMSPSPAKFMPPSRSPPLPRSTPSAAYLVSRVDASSVAPTPPSVIGPLSNGPHSRVLMPPEAQPILSTTPPVPSYAQLGVPYATRGSSGRSTPLPLPSAGVKSSRMSSQRSQELADAAAASIDDLYTYPHPAAAYTPASPPSRGVSTRSPSRMTSSSKWSL